MMKIESDPNSPGAAVLDRPQRDDRPRDHCAITPSLVSYSHSCSAKGTQYESVVMAVSSLLPWAPPAVYRLIKPSPLLRHLPLRLLAREFGALEAFAAGLGVVPEGAELRVELGLEPSRHGVDPPVTEGLRRLRSTRGARGKAALVFREVVPTRAYLRAHVPLARRGALGLWLARILRPFSLLASGADCS